LLKTAKNARKTAIHNAFIRFFKGYVYMNTNSANKSPVVIKKYANRRLYDTGTSAYITLEDLCTRVKNGEEFVVLDAKTGQDLTRQVLTQIIFEQETKGVQILPTDFLRSVIGMYDGKMQGVLQQYLDGTMKTFAVQQERLQGLMGKAAEGFSPFNAQVNPFEEITRQNVAMFEKAVQMMNPFGTLFGGKEEEKSAEKEPVKARAKR
jgi:polyhydroxyalkanoate synthesis repressor PhaR